MWFWACLAQVCVPTWESLGRQIRGRVSLGVEMNERSMVSGSLEPVIEAGVPGPSPSHWHLLMDSVWRGAMQLLATGLGLVLV